MQMTKRLMGILLVCSLLLGVVGINVHAESLSAQGWYSDSGDLSGWTLDNGVITGDFQAMVNKRIRRDCLTDMHSFVVEMDISGDNTSSPYIQIMGVILELDGNNGNGDQVFVKLAGEMLEWFDGDGTKVHVRIERVQDGNLKFTLTGSGRNNTKTYTAVPTKADPGLEIGMYRGGKVVVSGLKVTMANNGDNKVPAADYNRLVIPVTVGEHFEFCGAGNWRETNGWTAGVSTGEGIWIQSAEADGPNARAVYITEKLSENWYTSMTFKPISTTNDGRSVCRVVFMDANRGSVMLLTMEHLVADHKVKFGWQKNINGVWQDVWKDDDWIVARDEAFTVTLQKQSDTQIALSIIGTSGYRQTVTKAVDSGVMAQISRVGASAERTTVRITNIVVTARTVQRDYTALAKQTYQNLVKNYVDLNNERIRPVRWGFKNGDLTNTGQTVHVSGVGEVWESTVLMMALHTYAQTLEKDGEEWSNVADIIANTVNMLISGYTEQQLTTATVAPNHAMDDCAWNVTGLLLGYYYNRELGYKSASAKCLKYAKGLFNSSYDTFYTTELGGLAYTAKKEDVSLYGATMALAGYYLNRIEPDSKIEKRYLDIYNGIEKVLRRPDGLYWCGVRATGAEGADNPYGIREAGSVSYIGGNMAMAVLNSLLGRRDLAEQTVLGIVRYETYSNGAYLNDRDAWNNTFFMGLFVQEVIHKNIAGAIAQRALDATVSAILQNACFDDGHYSAAWLGPREPSSLGYPSQGNYSTDGRNNWGKGYNNNGLNIGSTPNQIMTSATTAHVLLAAALSASYEDSVPTDPAEPIIPTDPMNPEDPAIPTEPAGSDATEPIGPATPTAPENPLDPSDAAPTQSTKNTESADGGELSRPERPSSFDTSVLLYALVAVVAAVGIAAVVARRKKK